MRKFLIIFLGLFLYSFISLAFAGQRVYIIDDTNGSRMLAKIPNCTSGKLLYNLSSHEFTCGTDIGGSSLNNIVEDLTPQLGGDLGLNGFNFDFPSTPNISDVLDEDNMASDSATKLSTQQAIKAYVDSQEHAYAKKVVSMLVFDDSQDTVVTDGAGDVFYRIPSVLNGYNLTEVAAHVQTAGTTGTLDIQIHNATDTADMLSTVITIDTTEKDSSTAATPAVINGATDDVVTADEIRVDVDDVHTTAAKGLMIELTFESP